jgi:hypothetical protein
MATQGTVVFAAGEGKAARTTDNGVTWTDITAGLSFPYLRTLTSSGPYLLGGAGSGYVYASTDQGNHWSTVSGNLPSLEINALTVSGSDLYAGLIYGGVWRRPMAGLVVAVREGTEQKKKLEIQQYPNPFNGNSEFRLGISEFSFVRLQVFDLLGREIAVLVDGWKPADIYTVHFDGSRLASGTYIYRLQAGRATRAGTMVLIR